LATHVLRHWEAVGLLAPERIVAGHRRYGPSRRYRIAATLRAKQAGLGLDAVREIVGGADAASRRQVLNRHRETLVRQIQAAQSSLALIDHALDCEHGDLAECPRFQASLAHLAGLD
jgi:MerR family copper efflux transcriptional regulator